MTDDRFTLPGTWADDAAPARPAPPASLAVGAPQPGSSRRWRRPVVIGGVLVALLLAGWVAIYAAVSDSVPRHTTVAGVPIGRLSHARAAAKLERELGPRAAAPLAVTVHGERFDVPPGAAGLRLDADATVERTGGRSWWPPALWRALFGGGPVDPEVAVDSGRLDAAVAALAAKADRPAVEGAVRFAGAKATPVEPLAGRALERASAATALRAAYLTQRQPVTMPVTVVPPRVDAAEVARAMREFAVPALAAPVRLTAGRARIDVAPATLAATLSMVAGKDGVLTPRLDAARLEAALGRALRRIEVPPRGAGIRIEGGRPVVVPAVLGRVVDHKRLAAAVLAVLPKASPRTVALPLVSSQPSMTTAEAKALGIRTAVSEFTTYYPNASYRRTNIGRAAALINGTILEPGETFSLNQTVGERTAANGFARGTIIRNGRFFEDFGGGVSQVATTTFNAMFFAGLADVEHKPHSFYISRYPEGREATVAWPTVDLRFRNDSGHGIYIQTVHRTGSPKGSLTVRMFGTKRYDIAAGKSGRYNFRSYGVVYDPSSTCLPQHGVSGFDVRVYRVFRQRGEVVRRETFTTRYNAADQIYCSPAPSRAKAPAAPQASPAPSPTPSPAGAD